MEPANALTDCASLVAAVAASADRIAINTEIMEPCIVVASSSFAATVLAASNTSWINSVASAANWAADSAAISASSAETRSLWLVGSIVAFTTCLAANNDFAAALPERSAALVAFFVSSLSDSSETLLLVVARISVFRKSAISLFSLATFAVACSIQVCKADSH